VIAKLRGKVGIEVCPKDILAIDPKVVAVLGPPHYPGFADADSFIDVQSRGVREEKHRIDNALVGVSRAICDEGVGAVCGVNRARFEGGQLLFPIFRNGGSQQTAFRSPSSVPLLGEVGDSWRSSRTSRQYPAQRAASWLPANSPF
jgi:hypothetical protein